MNLKKLPRRWAARAVRFYQRFISPFLPKACVFYPTCSEYTLQAIDKYGAIKGTYLGARRILRCHPWQKEHIDPVK
jgi:uncharacterized protein